ncbi:MAG: hypothetical protein PHF29_03435 [Candidatus Riflebacteria bacterium]|nr:hypothetical protein [Candidatus Riflebacteria bacterium]
MFVNNSKIVLSALIFALCVQTSSEGALFGPSRKNQKTSVIKVENNNEALAKLFDLNDKKEASSIDPYNFAQNHFSLAATKLQTACRAISSFYNDQAARDIISKIYTINTQYFKEDVKNSALAVKNLNLLNFNINTGLQELSKVITSPGNETLENLEAVVEKIRNTNLKMTALTKKHLTATEKCIEVAGASYETFELIPSLSMPAIDMFVQSSKQLMRMTKSNSEAFKGLMLNILSSSEQIESGLESIKTNVRETLRFSDHFAIKQFPLINLPAPSREKIFVRLNSLANYVKGAENTLSIGESQVKNQAQQFTHLIGSFVDKSAESLKYHKSTASTPEQISNYAHNQISGLFLRVKEEILNLRKEMAKNTTIETVTPNINIETPQDYAVRTAKSVSSDKLPLFLLGNAPSSTPAKTEYNPVAKNDTDQFIRLLPSDSVRESMNISVATAAQIKEEQGDTLFSDNDFAFQDNNFEQSEMSIISQELKEDFFFAEKGEDMSENAILATGENMPDFGLDDFEQETLEGIKLDYSKMNDTVDPEFEMLRYAE